MLTEKDFSEHRDLLACMSLVHYYFGHEGHNISSHIKKYNISTDTIVDWFTNKVISNCLARASGQAKDWVLRAYKNIEEDFNYTKYFDESYFVDYK